MEGQTGDDPTGVAGRRTRRARARRRTSVVGVLGELLITVGVVVLLYVAWQLWLGDVIYGAQGKAAAQELSQQWAQDFEQTEPGPGTSPTPGTTDQPGEPPATAEPVILPEPADAEVFANMWIPRLGEDYVYEMAGGVSRARTLDKTRIGHYPGTSMPGQAGNFAVAAHRTTWGAPFNRIAELRIGDAIVVETPDGWYTYRFRTLEYVWPHQVEVLLPVPQQMDVPAGTAYITLTSCSPMYAMSERIIAYGIFDGFTPRSSGLPLALTEGV